MAPAFDVKETIIKNDGVKLLNDLLGHANTEIAEKAIQICHDYIETGDD